MEPNKKPSFFDPEFYDQVKSGKLKIISAEMTTVEKYFARNSHPIVIFNDENKAVRYVHKFSPESIEMAEESVHVNLITNEAYVNES